MVVVVSDTHASAAYELSGVLGRAVHEADAIVHAGDFTSEATLEAFQREADRLLAVHGNADDPGVSDRLPPARVFEKGGVHVAVVHTQRGGEMGLRYFAEERGADVVISGHTHRPRAKRVADVLLLNPGSHEQPRGGHATFAELSFEAGVIEGAIRTTDGGTVMDIAPEGRRSGDER